MNVKESWLRVVLFAAVCGITGALMVLIFGGGSMTAFMTTLAVGVGYAYGSFQMMYLYKKQVADAIQKLNEPEPKA
jgi:preprotein translocase subunit SecF